MASNGVDSSDKPKITGPAYSMHCTVCGKDYRTRLEWLRHLAELEHQTMARAECFKTWGQDQAMKECVVAVFCSFPLTYPGTVMDVLTRFSYNGDIVTDFAWWPERPRVGFMQFESKHKVAEVLKGLEASSAFVEDKLVQLKKVVDLLSLEWKELLPPELSLERPASSVNANNLRLPLLESSFATNATKSAKTSLMYDIKSGEIRMKSSLASSKAIGTPTYLSPTSIPYPPSVYIPNAHTPLQVQFNSICKSVEIPEDEFQHALEIVNVIKQTFREEHPSGHVIMFRNYYLRLRNTGSNVLLLFAYIADNPSDPNGFTYIRKEVYESIFNSSHFKQCLPGFVKNTWNTCIIGGSPFKHTTSGFRFNFHTDPLTITEAYLGLLLQYLCMFDVRVRPLITLIHFWAISQEVQIAEQNIPKDMHHSNCPEPIALEWLVILFLIHEGVIPPVREILRRAHKPVLISGFRLDIGFTFDEKYTEDWINSKSPVPCANSDEFIVSLITLAQKFFKFYSTNLEDGCWLLNPKDGEIIKRDGTHCHKSRLTPQETLALNVLQESAASKPHLIISNFRIYMLHPLYITRRLSFCVDTWTQSTCAKMKKTAERLDEFLNSIQSGSWNPKDVTLESVLAGSQHQAESVQFDLQCKMNQSLRTSIKTKVEQRKRKENRNSESGSDSNTSCSRSSKRKKF